MHANEVSKSSASSCSVIVTFVVEESSNDCCHANFSKGGAAKRSHCIATSVDSGFTVSVAKQYMCKNSRSYYTLPLFFPFMRTETATDLIFGALTCVNASCTIGKIGIP